MTKTKMWFALLITCAATTTACGSNETENIGETIGSKLSDYQATWEGYGEAYDFGAGSDRVALTLDANGHGTLRVGAGPDLPQPDPNVGYPPGAVPFDYLAATPLYPGFDYPVSSRRSSDTDVNLRGNHGRWV